MWKNNKMYRGCVKSTEASYQKDPVVPDLNATALFTVAVKYYGIAQLNSHGQ